MCDLEWKHGDVDRRIRAAIEIMQGNLSKRTSVAELARAVNLSRGRFCRLFKKFMSLSPSLYMKRLRMHETEKMLRETFLSVKEIRAELGDLDRGRFSREFKKFCGFTPSQFRKQTAGDSQKPPTQFASE